MLGKDRRPINHVMNHMLKMNNSSISPDENKKKRRKIKVRHQQVVDISRRARRASVRPSASYVNKAQTLNMSPPKNMKSPNVQMKEIIRSAERRTQAVRKLSSKLVTFSVSQNRDISSSSDSNSMSHCSHSNQTSSNSEKRWAEYEKRVKMREKEMKVRKCRLSMKNKSV